MNRLSTASLRWCLLAAIATLAGCGSDPSESNENTGGQVGSTGKGGSTGGGSPALGGHTGAGGSTSKGGAAGTGGSPGAGGSRSTGGSAGASSGAQPLGAICANDTSCSQAQGAAVCCRSTCTLSDQCPASTTYLPCSSSADCSIYGGGKLCCEVQSGGQAMRFCTKQSACSGTVLP
jgi:hypothetical protein